MEPWGAADEGKRASPAAAATAAERDYEWLDKFSTAVPRDRQIPAREMKQSKHQAGTSQHQQQQQKQPGRQASFSDPPTTPLLRYLEPMQSQRGFVSGSNHSWRLAREMRNQRIKQILWFS